ncbi:hypothetical protein [Actinoplanes missouriensis]|uniref:hypothetical protein n=1 Tax=Actinoplanes missouriensis TaxID=1866 RepID=UPI0012FBD3EA|nr:hypothetical protein [Actinoplanes missouriensis]
MSRPSLDGGEARPDVGRVRSRALLVSVAGWLGVAVVYLIVAFSTEGAPPGCSGIQCLNTRGMLLAMGFLFGLPMMLIGMALSAAAIVVMSRSARSGPVLGIKVTGVAIGVVLVLAGSFVMATF